MSMELLSCKRDVAVANEDDGQQQYHDSSRLAGTEC